MMDSTFMLYAMAMENKKEKLDRAIDILVEIGREALESYEVQNEVYMEVGLDVSSLTMDDIDYIEESVARRL